MTHLPIMADSVSPEMIPRSITVIGHTSRIVAAAYVNGWYAWTRIEEQSFGRVVRVSVEPGQPAAAKFARVLDVERFAATAADVPPFLHARSAAGHEDGTVYCSLSRVAEVRAHCDPHGLKPRWWLAWYWELPGYPSRQQIADELQGRFGTMIDLEDIWGCQFRTTPGYDLSVIYGTPDFSR